MRTSRTFCGVLLGLGLGLVVAGSAREEAADAPRVVAHYMPWFQMEPQDDGSVTWSHWQWFGKGPKHDPDDTLANGRSDIASVYYPIIGPYDGRDPAVLEYHFLTARAAGIDGFIADWYGPGTYSDEVFGEMVKMAERTGMKVAICLEEKAFFPDYSTASSRAEVLDVAEAHLRHVIGQHARSPAYMRIGGKPMVYLFLGHQDGALGKNTLDPEEFSEVLGRLEAPGVFFLRPHWDEPFLELIDGGFAWCGDREYRDWFYRTAAIYREEGRIGWVTGVASPGFDDRGVWGWGTEPRFTDRRDTAEFRDNWTEVLSHRPDAVQIVTWNDFEEGTTIEPTEEYGFDYVNLTEQFVEDFTGRRARTDDNDHALRVYRVRRQLEASPDAALAKRIDRFRKDMIRGKRFLMNHKLKRIEKAASRLVAKETP